MAEVKQEEKYCLRCGKEQCNDKECSVGRHLNAMMQRRFDDPCHRGWCNECINATLCSER